MPPPSDLDRRVRPRPVPGLLVAAERHLRIGSPVALAAAVTRSHLDDGRCVGWYGPPTPGWRVAIDAERADAPVPPALGRRFGVQDFWARWTRTECCCKLADVPVAAWWRLHGLGTPAGGSAVWHTLRVADLVVTVGFAPAPGAVPLPASAAGSSRLDR
ncbi:hypothetical protein O7631_15175 [Micromonospora sp. WMMD967]|uniref:hypothetical protein n=1 Tax=Micromonospora sp. WMMD967 TaxID=3016101 RepID=UPI0024172BF7|nr:hypothetical protein [Micromonospora sp. WMMD967]MDG4837862.1 hypothetical protein [Micromonospora sp. WMMD967]